MATDFRRELFEQLPALDYDEDALLYEWLFEKHGQTLRRQGPRATARIASRDVTEYFRLKDEFFRELSDIGLDLDHAADQDFALELWHHYDCGYSVLFYDYNVRDAAEKAAARVRAYLKGRKSATPSVEDAAALASRFGQENLEASVSSSQKQRDFILAFSEFLSKALQLDRGVLEFRRDVLGDSENTISHEEADDLVRSPAAQRLSMDFFNESGIPVVGHTATLKQREEGPHLLCVESMGKTLAIDVVDSQGELSFKWVTRKGRPQRPLVDESSILGRLGKLSDALTENHPVNVEDAAYFTLCGGTIQPRSISGRIDDNNFVQTGAYTYNHSTITLTVASWRSPEQVRQAYGKLRRQATANNTYRSKSDRNIAVFRFVIEKSVLQVPRDLVIGTRGIFRFPPWRQLVEDWNKQYRRGHRQRFDQPGYTAEKMFRNAFTSGYRAVTGLKYYALKPIITVEEVDSMMRKLKTRTETHGDR